jgi:hypothetical protein
MLRVDHVSLRVSDDKVTGFHFFNRLCSLTPALEVHCVVFMVHLNGGHRF